MRAFAGGCTLIAALALLPAASGAQGHGLIAAQGATLPGRYLVTTYNPKVNVTKPGNIVETVEILDSRGRVVRRFEQGRYGIGEARFSPDGTMVSWIDRRGLNVANVNGTGRRLLVAASTRCKLECVGLSYAWAPSSDTIAVGGAGVQTDELLTVDVQTGVATRIAPVTRFTMYDVIGYSPDGKALAVEIESGLAGTGSCCKSLLTVENPDGSGPRTLFSFFDAIHDGAGNATWSPDSSTLAFTDDGMDLRDPRFGIVNVAAATTRNVNSFIPTDSPPLWSPDGSEIAVSRWISGLTYSTNVFDLATGALTKIGLGDDPIAWYPDGTILGIGGKNSNILYAYNATGGTQQALFTLPKPLQFLTIEPAP